MYYIKSKRKQNNFSQNELNALKCFSSVEEVLNFADKVSGAATTPTQQGSNEKESYMKKGLGFLSALSKNKDIISDPKSVLEDPVSRLRDLQEDLKGLGISTPDVLGQGFDEQYNAELIKHAQNAKNTRAERALKKDPVHPIAEAISIAETVAEDKPKSIIGVGNLILDSTERGHLKGFKKRSPFIKVPMGLNYDPDILSLYNRTANTYKGKLPSNEQHIENIKPLREAFNQAGTPEELGQILENQEIKDVLKNMGVDFDLKDPKKIKEAYKVIDGLLKYDESLKPEERALHGYIQRNNGVMPA